MKLGFDGPVQVWIPTGAEQDRTKAQDIHVAGVEWFAATELEKDCAA